MIGSESVTGKSRPHKQKNTPESQPGPIELQCTSCSYGHAIVEYLFNLFYALLNKPLLIVEGHSLQSDITLQCVAFLRLASVFINPLQVLHLALFAARECPGNHGSDPLSKHHLPCEH